MIFNDYLKVIILHEGVLSNDKDDPGGITKYGISIRFLRKQGIDVDGDGDIDADDILALSPERAGMLYKEFFYDRLSRIPDGLLKLHLFDMGVNAGSTTAIKILQRTLCLSPDGIIGPYTLKAIDRPDIVQVYINARKEYYYNCTLRNPKLKKYLKGWNNRIKTTRF